MEALGRLGKGFSQVMGRKMEEGNLTGFIDNVGKKQ
jgi:hypothetical protein